MSQQKFTVFLMPLDEGGYQAFFPYFHNSVTDGVKVEDALANISVIAFCTWFKPSIGFSYIRIASPVNSGQF